jgi:hypothetical protein
MPTPFPHIHGFGLFLHPQQPTLGKEVFDCCAAKSTQADGLASSRAPSATLEATQPLGLSQVSHLEISWHHPQLRLWERPLSIRVVT